MIRVPLLTRKRFLDGPQVTSIIFMKKPGLTAFRYFVDRVLFLNKSIFRKLAILIVSYLSYYCDLHALKSSVKISVTSKTMILPEANYLENVINFVF